MVVSRASSYLDGKAKNLLWQFRCHGGIANDRHREGSRCLSSLPD